jgi:cytochrome P450
VTSLTSELEVSLTSPEFFQSPWPVYQALRVESPVYWCESWSQWLVTRHADVNFIMRHPELFSSSGWEARYLGQLPEGSQASLPNVYRHYGTKVVSNTDPPEHTRLRRLVQRSFSPRVIESIRERVEGLSRELLEGLADGSTVDWVSDVAYPLPATVIALLLGAPVEDTELFEGWSADIVAFVGSGSPQLKLALQEEQSLVAFRHYLGDLIARARVEPKDDLLSLLVEKSEDGDAYTDDELISTCMTILFAGHETTANLLSSLVLELLRTPSQWEAVVGNEGLAAAAVEETLRFNGPVQRIRRVAREDVEIRGVTVEKGQSVLGFIGSANRDEAVFEDAEVFNIGRARESNLAFGAGIHFCLGAALSRLEAPILLRQLADRFPRTRLAPSFIERYRSNMTFRGLESLELELRQ